MRRHAYRKSSFIRRLGRWARVSPALLAAVAMMAILPPTQSRAMPTPPLPSDFTPREPGPQCAPIVICDRDFGLAACREVGNSRHGTGNYALYFWNRTLTNPLPILALGSVAITNYLERCPAAGGARPAEVESNFQRFPIRVYSRLFEQFFFRSQPFWANEAKRVFGLTSISYKLAMIRTLQRPHQSLLLDRTQRPHLEKHRPRTLQTRLCLRERLRLRHRFPRVFCK